MSCQLSHGCPVGGDHVVFTLPYEEAPGILVCILDFDPTEFRILVSIIITTQLI